jgi:hypothetical protein
MPFLRRRANIASETDMRRLNAADDADQPNNVQQRPPIDSITLQPAAAHTVIIEDDDFPATSSHDAADQESNPESPMVDEENSKRRRFSILRFRNASDSQLSLRAKQHAEQPPPIPRRRCLKRPLLQTGQK